jgi:hypothetical protein
MDQRHPRRPFLEAIPAESRDRLRKLVGPGGTTCKTPDTLFQRVPEDPRHAPTVAVSRQTTEAAESSSTLSESWSASKSDDSAFQ